MSFLQYKSQNMQLLQTEKDLHKPRYADNYSYTSYYQAVIMHG